MLKYYNIYGDEKMYFNASKRQLIIISFLWSMLILVLCGCNNSSSNLDTISQAPSNSTLSSDNTVNSSQQEVSSKGTVSNSGSILEENLNKQNESINSTDIDPNSDFSFLNNSVFVGDSVSLKLKNYVTAKRKSNSSFFGNAKFLTAGSLGATNALWEISDKSVHPLYQGKKMKIEDSVSASGAKKVYIMLGMNDIGAYSVDESAKNMSTLLSNIKDKSPNITIIVQSVTPMIKQRQLKNLNNSNIEKYNQKIKQICESTGYKFLDVASVMKDSEGNLPASYCSDPEGLGVHFTDSACQVWINYILQNKL